MDVTYQTTLDDFVVLNRRILSRSKICRGAFLFGWLAVPISLLGACLFGSTNVNWETAFSVVLTLGAATYFFLFPPVYRRLADSLARRFAQEQGTKGVLGNIRLILTNDSLTEVTETTRSETRWTDIHGIEESGDYTFIFVTPLSVAILPKHGFSSEEKYEQTKAFAMERLSKQFG